MDYKNNDPGILNHMIQRNAEEASGMIYIYCGSAKDSADVLSNVGIKMEMPWFFLERCKAALNRGIELFQIDN